MRRNVNARPRRVNSDVAGCRRRNTTGNPTAVPGARRKREEERGGPGPGDRGGGLSAELKYDPAVRSHSATTVTMRLTKQPYTRVNVSQLAFSPSLSLSLFHAFPRLPVTKSSPVTVSST